MTSELLEQRDNAINNFTGSRISRHWELFQNRPRERFSRFAPQATRLAKPNFKKKTGLF